MAEIKTILYATDFSEGSVRACQITRELVSLTGAKLVILHVINEIVDKQNQRMPTEILETLIAEVEQHAIEDMRRFRDAHFADLNAMTELGLGKASEEILSHAEKHDADLIVMGTHGRAGIERLFVGSTAEQVVRSSKIPVLTVRE